MKEVIPARIYCPDGVLILWLKVWTLQCGNCGKDFTRFSFFGRPKCRYCGAINVLRTCFLMYP